MKRFMILLSAFYGFGCSESQSPPRQARYSPMTAQETSSSSSSSSSSSQESSLFKESHSLSQNPNIQKENIIKNSKKGLFDISLKPLTEKCFTPEKRIKTSFFEDPIKPENILFAYWHFLWTHHSPLEFENTVKPELLTLGFSHVEFFNLPQTNLQAILSIRDDLVFLSFRGSQEIQDWILDMKFATTPGEKYKQPGWIHSGFASSLQEFWPLFQEVLKKQNYQNQPFVVSGHSLGGALALLASHRLVLENKPLLSLYTFGQPRVGDIDFIQHVQQNLSQKYYRFVYENDLVTHIPPKPEAAPHFKALLPLQSLIETSVKLMRYQHGGEHISLNASTLFEKKGTEDNDIDFWKEAENKKQNLPDFIKSTLSVGNQHKTENYSCALLKILP